MHRTGLAPYGQDDDAVRWVAVRHAADHIHIVAMLARQDGARPGLWNDYYQVGEACRAAEQRFGLRLHRPRDRTAARRPTRAESEKARRRGLQEAPRVTLRRAVSTAAAGAASEQEFFARLGPGRGAGPQAVQHPQSRRGHRVRRRAAWRHRPEGGPVWFGGGKLAAGPDPAQAPLPLGPRPAPRPQRSGPDRRGTERDLGARRPHRRRRRRADPLTGPDDPPPRPTPPGLRPTRCTRPRRRWAAGCSARRPTPSTGPPGPVRPGASVVAPDGISLRRSARLLSASASDRRPVDGPDRAHLPLARLAEAVAELREAQRHAAQAAAARGRRTPPRRRPPGTSTAASGSACQHCRPARRAVLPHTNPAGPATTRTRAALPRSRQLATTTQAITTTATRP